MSRVGARMLAVLGGVYALAHEGARHVTFFNAIVKRQRRRGADQLAAARRAPCDNYDIIAWLEWIYSTRLVRHESM